MTRSNIQCVIAVIYLLIIQVTVISADTHDVGTILVQSSDDDYPHHKVSEWIDTGNLASGFYDTARVNFDKPSEAGQWQFIQVMVYGTNTTATPAVFFCYAPASSSSNIYLSNNDDLSDLGVDIANNGLKRFDAVNSVEDYIYNYFPSEVQIDGALAGNADDLELYFRAVNSTHQWKIKMRAFYALDHETEFSFDDSKIEWVKNDLIQTGSSFSVLAGQNALIHLEVAGVAKEDVAQLQVYDSYRLLGDMEWDTSTSKWTYDVSNLSQGYHFFQAFVTTVDGRSGWTDSLQFDAEWYDAKIVFGGEKDVSHQIEDKHYLGDGGLEYGLVPNKTTTTNQLITEAPLNAEWNYGWRNFPANITTTSTTGDLLLSNYASFYNVAGLANIFEAQVPEGTYKISIHLGSAISNPEVFKFRLEGIEYSVNTHSFSSAIPGSYETFSVEIPVRDGQITLESVSPEFAPKLNAINIQQVSTSQELRDKSHYKFINNWGIDIETNDLYEIATLVRPISGQQAVIYSEGISSKFVFAPEKRFLWNTSSSAPLSAQSGLSEGDASWWLDGSDPFLLFGSKLGAQSLYTNQGYSVLFDPEQLKVEADGTADEAELQIRVLNAADGSLVETLPLQLDRLNDWTSFGDSASGAGKGYTESFEFSEHNLSISVSLSLYTAREGNKRWVFSHQGGLEEYVYVVESNSVCDYFGATYSLARNATYDTATDSWAIGGDAYTMLFAFSVEASKILTTSTISGSFAGSPRPSSYYGATIEELNSASQNLLTSSTNPLTLDSVDLQTLPEGDPLWDTLKGDSSLDQSPELRSHTLLNELHEQLNGDPFAIANYVQNEINLCDAIGYNQSNQGEGYSIDPGGIQRAALGCYLEEQGSPHEQCALLVYLLRKADIPAAYVMTDRNELLVSTDFASKMLRTQLEGMEKIGSLTALNYPWVVAYIDDKWVHLFPWIEDVEITEGLDLYPLMQEEYNSGWKWFWKYAQGDEDILPFQLRYRTDGDQARGSKLIKEYWTDDGVLFEKQEVYTSKYSSDLPSEYDDIRLLSDSDQPYQLFPRFVKWQLREQGHGISYDQIGLQVRVRPRYFSQWEDFPKPTRISGDFKVLDGFNDIPRIFDTIRYQVVQAYETSYFTNLDTGELLLCDLHNRKVYVERWDFRGNGTKEIGIVMAPYDEFEDGVITEGFSPYDHSSYVEFDRNENLSAAADEGGSITFENQRKGRFKILTAEPPGDIEIRITHKRQRNTRSATNGTSFSARSSNEYYDTPFHTELNQAYDFTTFVQDEIVQGLEYTDTNNLDFGLFALCIQTGKVTSKMLNAHVRNLWRYEYERPDTPVADIDYGARSYLMGMSYWQYLSLFKSEMGLLHKVVHQGDYGHLFSGLKYEESAGVPNLPSIDIYRGNTLASVYSASPNPLRGEDSWDVTQDYYHLLGCQGSAYEHGVMEKYYGQVGSISTMRIFHLAKAAREHTLSLDPLADVSGDELIVINADNYAEKLATVSISHEIEDKDSKDLDEFYAFSNDMLASFDPSLLSSSGEQRAKFRVGLLAPKYYKYFDNGGLALDCAGYAPIPDAGTMGGTIAPDSLVRQYSYWVQTPTAVQYAGSNNIQYYGRFTAPTNQTGFSSQTSYQEGVNPSSDPKTYSLESWQFDTTTGARKNFLGWYVYENTPNDDNPANDRLVQRIRPSGIDYDLDFVDITDIPTNSTIQSPTNLTISASVGSLNIGSIKLDNLDPSTGGYYQVRVEPKFDNPHIKHTIATGARYNSQKYVRVVFLENWDYLDISTYWWKKHNNESLWSTARGISEIYINQGFQYIVTYSSGTQYLNKRVYFYYEGYHPIWLEANGTAANTATYLRVYDPDWSNLPDWNN
ncbi:MAG: hypothetical protein ACSHX0_10450 [Akkermansiaceae bacterium]